jgi:DNA-binding NarL/FixJ family response regulator
MIRVCLIGANVGKEKALLESQPEIQLHAIDMDDTETMLKTVCRIHPDILVLSEVGCTLPANELCLHAYLRAPDIKTLIITEHEADYEQLEATGFSCKGFMPYEQRHSIVRAVRVMYDGEAWLSRKLVTKVLDELAGSAAKVTPPRPKLVKR